MPFWVIGVLITLSLLFFLANYVNAIAWQVRAQNAADSAASGALSVQANVFNEYSLLLYTTAVDEYRLRVLNQAILNTVYGVGGCNTGKGQSCDQNYMSLVNEYNVALNGYTDDIHLLDQANNVTQGGQNTDQAKAITHVQNGDWCASATDYACQFQITVVKDTSYTGSNGNGVGNRGDYLGPGYNEMDVAACKKIPYFAPALLKLGNVTSYPVLARSAAAVIPANSEAFNPGKQTNPLTGQVFQPTETQWAAGFTGPAYQVDFTGLTVNLDWYVAGPIRPFGGNLGANSYTCS